MKISALVILTYSVHCSPLIFYVDRDIFNIMRFKIISSKQFVTLHYDTLRYVQDDAVVHGICNFSLFFFFLEFTHFFHENLSHCNSLLGVFVECCT